MQMRQNMMQKDFFEGASVHYACFPCYPSCSNIKRKKKSDIAFHQGPVWAEARGSVGCFEEELGLRTEWAEFSAITAITPKRCFKGMAGLKSLIIMGGISQKQKNMTKFRTFKWLWPYKGWGMGIQKPCTIKDKKAGIGIKYIG